MHRPTRALLASASATLLAVVAGSGSALAQRRAEPLEVLAFVADAARDPDPVEDLLRVPAEHVGLRLVRHRLGAGAPGPVDAGRTRGILFALDADDPIPGWLWPWLTRQPAELRVVVFGSLEPLARSAPNRAVFAAWLDRFGLADDGPPRRDPARVAIVHEDRERCRFESPPAHAWWHVGPRVVDDAHDAWLLTVDPAEPRVRRAGIVTGAFGGLALEPWAWRPGGPGARRFHIDPFAFLRAAFGLDGVPVADPSMVLGSRRFLLEFDAAGATVPVEDGRGTCADVVARELVDRFRLPATVVVPPAQCVDLPAPLAALLGRPEVTAAVAAAAGDADWITAAVDALSRHGFSCRAVVWPDDAHADPSAVEAFRARGCESIAADGSRRDASCDTLTALRARGRYVGPAVLAGAAAVSARVYDPPERPLPGAARHLAATFRATGAPRVLAPVHLRLRCDVAASTPARLAAAVALIEDWGLEPGTAPCSVADYAAAVVDASTATWVARTSTGWRCGGFDACRSLRFDGEPRDVDLAGSRGVAGSHRDGDTLWVHLSAATADVVLTERPEPRPHVSRADHDLQRVELGAAHVAFTSRGHPGRRVVLAGWPADTELRIAIGSRVELRASDADGRVQLVFPESDEVQVRVEPR